MDQPRSRHLQQGNMVPSLRRYLVLLLVGLGVSATLLGCAPQRRYAKTPSRPGEKVVVLPSAKRYSKLTPYWIKGQKYYPLPDAQGYIEFGKASWYGKDFHGRRTASGETYDMYKMTAAHKTLPMDTYVLVHNLSNGKKAVVRINDRGPFVKGRVIDLSYAAAKRIGMLGPGVARVKVVALGKEIGKVNSALGPSPVLEVSNLNEGQFTIQVGAFRDRKNALILADRLRVIFDYVVVSVLEKGDGDNLYRVRVTRCRTLTQAGKMERRLERMGFEEAFIVRL